MLPSSTDLTYFAEIAKTGNLSQAATRLGVSQPSLSLAMQRLEHCLGAPLLVRSRLGVKLTKAGEQLLADTLRLLEDWENLARSASSSMSETKGRFTLGCHVSVAKYSLPLFLPQLLQKHSELEVNLQHDLSRHLAEMVRTLALDLAIVVNPIKHPDLVMKSLGSDVVTVWQSRRNLNSDVLICEPSLLQTQSILRKLKRNRLEIKRVIESSSLEVIASLVECGAGLGILPTRVAKAHSSSLVAVKGAPTFDDEIMLIYRTEYRSVRAIRELSESIQRGFASSRR